MPVATETIAKALRIVAAEGIQTEDGVIEACLRQAADRLEELESVNAKLVEVLEKVLKHHKYVDHECTWHLEANAQVGLWQLLRDVGVVVALAKGGV